MTSEPTIVVPRDRFAFAQSLVEQGRFPSLVAVVRHALELVENEERAGCDRLEAIRADLAERASGPSVGGQEMAGLLAAWRSERDQGEDDHLA